MNKFFYVDDTPYYPGKFVIRLKHEKFGFSGFRGSCNCIPAKLMMLYFINNTPTTTISNSTMQSNGPDIK